ncbi:MAG: sensor histidine kinase [Erysipelotrichaceae bacterium]
MEKKPSHIEQAIALLSQKLKLGQQFTLLIFVGVFIPVFILYNILFSSMTDVLVENKKRETQYEFDQMVARIEKTSEMANRVTQLVVNNTNLRGYLQRLADGESLDYDDLNQFYSNEVSSIEKIVLSNPYLYQVRIYANSNHMQELMPILYQVDRIERLDWNIDSTFQSGWIFNYADSIFPTHIVNPTQNVMGLVTRIDDYQGNLLGYIEVAIQMHDVFPEYFQQTQHKLNMLVKQEELFYDKSIETELMFHADEILKDATKIGEIQQFQEVKMRNQTYIVNVAPVKILDTSIVQILSMQEISNQLASWGTSFIIGLIVTALVLFLIIHLLVKVILRRFYVIYTTVLCVQDGNLAVRVSNLGSDEVGQLGVQINKMLDKIAQLMQDSIKRELLTKNSEIRALQNQINAHFIYNVLESIKMMAEIEERYEISDAVTALGKLLRYSMKWTARNVPIEDEINYIKNYLSLLNLRYDYTISLQLDLPEEIMRQTVPKMSLQPIVENAVCHGIEEFAQDTVISIRGLIANDNVLVEIADYGKGMSATQIDAIYNKMSGEIETGGGSGNGIGLKNVQDRIRICYGERFGITLDSKVGEYTKVILKIPYQKKGDS